jgi:hypothetical protein
MSAFIVSDNHIHALLTAGLDNPRYGALRWFAPESEEPRGDADTQAGEPWGPTAIESANRRRRELTRDTADAVGLMLLAQNYASVNYRYDEHEEEPLYRFQELGCTIDPVVVFKAIDCYNYQSCESPDWEETEAYAFCQALRSKMIHALPGYDAAPWGIDDPHIFGGGIRLSSLIRKR